MGNTVTAQYAYGNALIRKDGEYPLFDGLGSERTVTNASQTVTGTLNLDAFGNQAGSTGSSSNPYMYAATSGYRNDGDAGLVHVGARYYDAQVGRWTSRDTVLSEHPYLYCGHDPVNRTDPTGHFGSGDVVGALMAGLGYALLRISAVAVVVSMPAWLPWALLAAGTICLISTVADTMAEWGLAAQRAAVKARMRQERANRENRNESE